MWTVRIGTWFLDFKLRMASKYWMAMHLSSWAPRAKIFPSGVRTAEKGGWDHLEGSAGTESRWELKRSEGRDGLEPGQVKRRWSLLGVNSKVWALRPMDCARETRKKTGAV